MFIGENDYRIHYKKNPYSWKPMLLSETLFGFPNDPETQKGFQIVTNTLFFTV